MKDDLGNIVPNAVMTRMLPKGVWDVESSRTDEVQEVRKPMESAVLLRAGQEQVVKA